MEKNYFITAIDTDAGKSVVTGILARFLRQEGINVITQKMAQTGNTHASEDIENHRRIMESYLFPEDRDGTTCPYIFPFPATPALSASMVGEDIDPGIIRRATETLCERYECVLTEGVGGWKVPLSDTMTVADYVAQYPAPLILVTNGKLGSINHTLLTLESILSAGLEMHGMVFNNFIETDPRISDDTRRRFKSYLKAYYPDAVFAEIGRCEPGSKLPDLAALFRME